MPKILTFSLSFDDDLDSYMRKNYARFVGYRILSQSLDARGAPSGKKPVFLYKIEAIHEGESFSSFDEEFKSVKLARKPIIIGAGPAGLFCALRFAEYGIPTIVIERGEEASKRMIHIARYWRYGELNPESNVCYGEGGAGLFSDGKLITRIKSDYVKYVMKKFVEYGAPKETEYMSNPHLGSNKIRSIISKISDDLKNKGSLFYYNTKVVEILFSGNKVTGVLLSNGEKLFSDHVIVATGHSAKDIFYELHSKNVAMKQKDFAVGVRIEHPREYIDFIQHGKFSQHEILKSARYRLSYHNEKTDKGTYSFCMCPGGYVLSSGTEKDGIVVNGMSNFSRNSPWSNSALVVSVKAGVDFDSKDLFAGLKFQEEIEKKAYEESAKHATGRELPAMRVSEFLEGRLSGVELPKTSAPSSLVHVNLHQIFPKFIIDHLKTALREFDRSLKGYLFKDALLIAPETRTSSPLTIARDKESLESVSHKGLYPCGEGAGYAGGITSAAVDGIKVCESIIKSVQKP